MLDKALGRYPDRIIGSEDDPYLLRWHVIPRNRFFNIYLHKFCKSDDDRALHDHPWLFNVSVLLKGSYCEHLTGGRKKHRKAGLFSGVKFRWGKSPHRVELLKDGYPYGKEQPVWTLFVTGAIVREWGFYCPKGWRHWKEFVKITEKGNERGAGCGE